MAVENYYTCTKYQTCNGSSINTNDGIAIRNLVH